MNLFRLSIEIYCKFKLRNTFCKHTFSSRLSKGTSYNDLQHRCNFFHSSVPLKGKIYQEQENEYAHDVLEKRSTYSSTIIKHPLNGQTIPFPDDPSPSNSSIFDEFAKTSIRSGADHINFQNPKFSTLIKNVTCALNNASDKQIVNTLHCLCLWPPAEKTYVPNFKMIWNGLDDECTRRLKNWTVQHKLVIADYWFHLRLSRITKYNTNLIVNLIENIDKLSNSEVVHLLFCVILQRKVPHEFLKIVEYKLESFINDIDLEELSVICLAFFKTESKVYNPLVIKSIIQRLGHEVMQAKSITISAILKFLRKSLRNDLIEMYIMLMHTCIPCIKYWDVSTSVQLALLSSETNVYHPILLDQVSERLLSEIETIRIKDGLKLLQSVSHFNHLPLPAFTNAFFTELGKKHRRDEIQQRPRELVFIFLFYAYMNHYKYNWTSKVMDKNFIDLCISKHGLDESHCLVHLDYCIAIDCPEYNGPRIEKSILRIINDRRGNFLSNSSPLNSTTKLLRDVVKFLTELQGSDHNILIRHVLPHIFTPDVILRLNSTVVSAPLSEIYRDYPEESILIPPNGEIWACFVVSGLYSFAYKSQHKTGLTAMKLRQLEKLGYRVVFIPHHDIPENQAQRKMFIKEKLEQLEKDIKCQFCINYDKLNFM